MKIDLIRNGDDLEVLIDELCIVVRDRYRRRLLGTKRQSFPHVDIDTLLSASKDLHDGETTALKDQYKAEMDNLDKAIKEVLSEIPAEEKRRLLNESINAYSRKQEERRLDDLGSKKPDMEDIPRRRE